ncbi:hypothetical protein [Nostoc sp. JL33]|uniref:hypothetical protein n=1 Tax=Nostoc sp. JL33 TaxID=2815396 RepID=UPI0025F7A47E|nr:hypothetical protein [Nostoc sp. JL33]MBN3871141.1 hypothetical protein [Nostoc sp. JL33]
MYETFIDLDELIVRCRDKQAKKFIQEAVACYRAGAFRSCIVATWNAVVFDFLHKLRELDLLGNGEASSLLKQFENISSASKVKDLWQFESSIPDLALTKFELISSVEKSDIERLFEDRSRCAHPSMTSLEEPFEGTAELARYHLRSAVMHLLQRPPVQGRSARERIFQDIKSDYFPTDPELAAQYFQKSPLARARFILIKDIVLGLTISLLTDNFPEDERARQFSALNAIYRIYPKETVEILDNTLSNIIINKVNDANWHKVIIYLGSIKGWDVLSDSCQIKAKSFIEKLEVFDGSSTLNKRFLPKIINILVKASYISFLKEYVINKLKNIPLKDLLLIKELCEDKNFKKVVINDLFRGAVPQANLNELILIRLEADEKLDGLIEPYLREQLKEASLEKLVLIMLRYENESLNQLIEPWLKNKINDAPLDELLEARRNYQVLDVQNEELTKLFDDCVSKLISKLSFDEIIEQSEYWDEFSDDSFQSLLKENIPIIVSKFINSYSYVNAISNTDLIIKIAEHLSIIQWEQVLEAFCKNNQIYGSRHCPGRFCLLLKKSVDISGTIPYYWLSFREELNKKFKFKDVDIDRLKNLIDSYQIAEF